MYIILKWTTFRWELKSELNIYRKWFQYRWLQFIDTYVWTINPTGHTTTVTFLTNNFLDIHSCSFYTPLIKIISVFMNFINHMCLYIVTRISKNKVHYSHTFLDFSFYEVQYAAFSISLNKKYVIRGRVKEEIELDFIVLHII